MKGLNGNVGNGKYHMTVRMKLKNDEKSDFVKSERFSSRSEVTQHLRRIKNLINSQQGLIGGERLSWEKVKEFKLDQEQVLGNQHMFRVGNIVDTSFLNFLPKPVVVSPRKEGLTSTGRPQQCHKNVEELVLKYGGEGIYGFELFQYMNSSIKLNYHSVWKTPEGKFVDVTQMGYEGRDYPFHPRPRKGDYLFVPISKHSDDLEIDFGLMKGEGMIVSGNTVSLIGFIDNNEENGLEVKYKFDNRSHFQKVFYICFDLNYSPEKRTLEEESNFRMVG